jgi:hypothetical protein
MAICWGSLRRVVRIGVAGGRAKSARSQVACGAGPVGAGVGAAVVILITGTALFSTLRDGVTAGSGVVTGVTGAASGREMVAASGWLCTRASRTGSYNGAMRTRASQENKAWRCTASDR